MPPRTVLAAADSLFNLTSLFLALPRATRPQAYTQCSACLFSTSPIRETIAKKRKKRKMHGYRDPYRLAQARQRKAANIARQQVLGQEREAATGDSIRSNPTPFVSSLSSKRLPTVVSDYHLNYFVNPDELEKSLEYSQWLTEPVPNENENLSDPRREMLRKEKHATQHENAQRALAAITALENSSSADRKRINIQRCIEEFGRHKTDAMLPARPKSTPISPAAAAAEAARDAEIVTHQRAGPDTGSSEVQAAILTAKINVLADNLYKKDKHNKRNLRLLVHKRQKMLSYLRRKERGGPRWQNLVEKLGIGDAMWKGEISL